jgi:LmbE family N-acetylglucosaminyl deacetylase
MKRKMLVVAAHPDDEVLGCGGTIARLAQEGHDIFISILGEGITSRYDSTKEADGKLVKELHTKSQRVAEFLGAKDLFMYNQPDNRFDTIPILDIVKIIENLIYKLKPEVVYTQDGGDLNIDHAISFRASLTATRPIKGCPVRELYAYEVPSSSEWSFGQFEPAFKPNVFVDIRETLDIKVKALQLYESEVRSFPHPRSPEAIRAIAERWGSLVGCEAAEAFKLIRAVR